MAIFHDQRYHFRLDVVLMTLNLAHLDIAHFGSVLALAFSKRVLPQTGWRGKTLGPPGSSGRQSWGSPPGQPSWLGEVAELGKSLRGT